LRGIRASAPASSGSSAPPESSGQRNVVVAPLLLVHFRLQAVLAEQEAETWRGDLPSNALHRAVRQGDEVVRGGVKTSSDHVGVTAAFLIHAIVSGTWAPRLAAIKSSLALSDGVLGTALVGLAVGLLAGTRLAGAPVDRFGSRPVMRAGFPLLCATLLLPALAQSAATLFLGFLALGLASGMLDVAMNAQGVQVERHRRRPLLSGLHGFWSVGLGLGAGTATLAAAIGAAPLLHFAVVATVLGVASVALMRGLVHAALLVLPRCELQHRDGAPRHNNGERAVRCAATRSLSLARHMRERTCLRSFISTSTHRPRLTPPAPALSATRGLSASVAADLHRAGSTPN
jgi:MFS family permease